MSTPPQQPIDDDGLTPDQRRQLAYERRVEAAAERLRRAGIVIDPDQLAAAKRGELKPVAEGATCPTCGGVGSVPINPAAAYDDPAFGKVMPCPDPVHYPQRQARLARLSNLSEQQLEIRLSDCREYYNSGERVDVGIRDEQGRPRLMIRQNRQMLTAFRSLVDNPYQHPFIYAWGPWGGGKTYASIALINEINAARRGPAMFIAWQDLLAWIKASFDDRNRVGEFGDWSEQQRYDLLISVPFLVVDEFDFSDGKTQISEWNLSLMQRWLNARYLAGIDGRAATVFVSNDSPESMGLGGIISRLDDGRNLKILNTAPDFRKGAK
jgi:DNA replication protein DnaC